MPLTIALQKGIWSVLNRSNVVLYILFMLSLPSVILEELWLPLRYTWTSRFFLCKGEDNGAWCPESSDKNLNWEVRFPRLMAVSGLNFEHPSQKDVYTYPNMFMKTLQLKFISALDPLREWRSYTKVKESFEIIWCFISVFYFRLSFNCPFILQGKTSMKRKY